MTTCASSIYLQLVLNPSVLHVNNAEGNTQSSGYQGQYYNNSNQAFGFMFIGVIPTHHLLRGATYLLQIKHHNLICLKK